MEPNTVVSREEWTEARVTLLGEEKAFSKARDALAEKRRSLPWVKVSGEYVFETNSGRKSLSDLFSGSSQLAVYHFMFTPEWDEGCPACGFWADTYNQAHEHLTARDIAFAVASRAPLEKLNAYRDRFGWDFNWVSTVGDTFNRDFGVTLDAEAVDQGRAVYNYKETKFPGTEAPGLSVFAKDEKGTIYHTYSTYGRGLEEFNGIYHLMDMTPKGRNEGQLDFPMAWLRRRDQY